jgi:flagellar biosynthetic protein FliO
MKNLLILFKRWFETSSKKQKWTALLTVVGLLCTIALFSLDGSGETSPDPLGSTPLYFAGAFIKLVVVLLLIVVSAIFARRWLQPGPHGKSVRQMRLMESVRLSPRQALHLVSIGDRQFLIGATDQNVTLISPVEVNFDTTPVEATNPQPTLDFGSLLQSFNINLPGHPSK